MAPRITAESAGQRHLPVVVPGATTMGKGSRTASNSDAESSAWRLASQSDRRTPYLGEAMWRRRGAPASTSTIPASHRRQLPRHLRQAARPGQVAMAQAARCDAGLPQFVGRRAGESPSGQVGGGLCACRPCAHARDLGLSGRRGPAGARVAPPGAVWPRGRPAGGSGPPRSPLMRASLGVGRRTVLRVVARPPVRPGQSRPVAGRPHLGGGGGAGLHPCKPRQRRCA